MSDSSLNLWDSPSISAPIMGCFFIVIMSPHQQFDRQFTIHKEVQILTKKQERRTTTLPPRLFQKKEPVRVYLLSDSYYKDQGIP